MQGLLPLLLFSIALVLAQSVWAAGQATPDEAKAMAIKAAEYLKANGAEKAFPEFTNKDGPWHDRDLYVIVMNNQGILLSNDANPGMVGKSLINLKDVDGKAFVVDEIAIKDEGWISFKWRNPLTNAIEPKTQYEVRVGDMLVGVGAFGK
jgi:cytochrome c